MQLLLICVLLPLALAAPPSKRFFVDTLLASNPEVQRLYSQLVSKLQTDETEQACEQECHVLIQGDGSLFEHACPFLCHAFQNGVKHLPGSSGGMMPTTMTPAGPAKRFFVDTLLGSNPEVQRLYTQLVANLQTDETEQACEKECHVLIQGDGSLFEHACPFLCHAFQNGAKHLPGSGNTMTTMAPAGPAKRFFIDSILGSNPEVQRIYTQLVSKLQTDETEQACEQECHVLIQGDGSLLEHACPFLCHAFQNGMKHLPGSSGSSTGGVTKRFLIDTLTSNPEFKLLLTMMVDTLGSDPTEQQCEAECIKVIHEEHVLNYACPFICHSFQELVHRVKINPQSGTQKRFLVDSFANILGNPEVQRLYTQLVSTLSSDETEMMCESQCHALIVGDQSVFEHACPFLCHLAQSGAKHLPGLSGSGMNPAGGAATGTVTKRFLIDSLLQNPEINVLVTTLVSTLGSDPTEQACEIKCVELIHKENLLHHACPLVCHSFQELVHHIHLDSMPTHPE